MSETQVAQLAEQVAGLASEVAEFRTVHVSRRGVQGIAGPQGETGPAGPSADPRHVAEIAAELVAQKFAHKLQVAKFEKLLGEFEAEIKAAKAAIQWAVIEELKQAGVIDQEGRAVPGPQGATGSQGPQGERGKQGDSGRDGVNGVDGVDGKSVTGPRGDKGDAGADSTVPGPSGERGERGEIGPEGLQGLPGEGVSRTEVIEIVRDMKRRGTI